MNGKEIMEGCKSQTMCSKCPEDLRKACEKWKAELIAAEPWQMQKIIEEKEY